MKAMTYRHLGRLMGVFVESQIQFDFQNASGVETSQVFCWDILYESQYKASFW